MKTAFLITNGNMGGTAGDATLILRRAKSMYDKKGMYTKILLLNPVEQGNVNRGDYFYSIEKCAGKKALTDKILKEKPQLIILYGDKIQMMTAAIHKFAEKNRIPAKVVVDIQGAIEEKKEYSSSFVRKFVIYPISRYFFTKAVKNADAAFVVSDEIRDKCEKARKNKPGQFEYYKVRCGFEEFATVEQIKEYRAEFRKNKNIAENTKVFCYSGYRAGWQKVDDIIKHFSRFDKFDSNCYFAFFCNTDERFEALLKETFPHGNYCLELLKPQDYFKSLCGCDVGYILRDYNETNRVAFPNKFSDYLGSGLIVALNNALPEPMRLIKKMPMHYTDTDTVLNDIETLFQKLSEREADYDKFVKDSLEFGKEELLYNTQIQKLNI